MLVITIVLLLLLLCSIYYQRYILKKYVDDIGELINEADAVKGDLNRILTGAVDLSHELIEELNDKIQEVSSLALTANEELRSCAAEGNTNQVKEDITDYDPKTSFLFNLDTGNKLDYEISTADKEISKEGLLQDDIDYNLIHPDLAVKLLYEKGLGVRDIAQIIGRGQGEVNLILNLHAKKKAI